MTFKATHILHHSLARASPAPRAHTVERELLLIESLPTDATIHAYVLYTLSFSVVTRRGLNLTSLTYSMFSFFTPCYVTICPLCPPPPIPNRDWKSLSLRSLRPILATPTPWASSQSRSCVRWGKKILYIMDLSAVSFYFVKATSSIKTKGLKMNFCTDSLCKRCFLNNEIMAIAINK